MFIGSGKRLQNTHLRILQHEEARKLFTFRLMGFSNLYDVSHINMITWMNNDKNSIPYNQLKQSN
jgi:hypothetical protein